MNQQTWPDDNQLRLPYFGNLSNDQVTAVIVFFNGDQDTKALDSARSVYGLPSDHKISLLDIGLQFKLMFTSSSHFINCPSRPVIT